MGRLIIAGEPGREHVNDSGKILYQLIVNWHNSCAVCCQFDRQIGTFWAVPFHRGCRCVNRPVLPGRTAEPFVDYREKIRQVSPAQRAAIMGRANLTLVEKGIVDWGDVVTSGRIRSLREVVARNKLTVDALVDAGVGRRIATEAWDAVHTNTHTASERRRKQLADSILAKGYTREQLRDAGGRAIASRLSIGSGPSGPSSFPVPPPTPKPAPKPKAPAKAAMEPAKAPRKAVSAVRTIKSFEAVRRLLESFVTILASKFGITYKPPGE